MCPVFSLPHLFFISYASGGFIGHSTASAPRYTTETEPPTPRRKERVQALPGEPQRHQFFLPPYYGLNMTGSAHGWLQWACIMSYGSHGHLCPCPWDPMEARALISCPCPMEAHGVPWALKGRHGFQWASPMRIHGLPWGQHPMGKDMWEPMEAISQNV